MQLVLGKDIITFPWFPTLDYPLVMGFPGAISDIDTLFKWNSGL
jgi:hypothetical protein